MLSFILAATLALQPVTEQSFTTVIEADGVITFNEELAVQLQPDVSGRIVTLFAKVGDDVKRGDALYTLESQDLVQASSTLIAAAATFELSNQALARAKKLFAIQAVAEKELEQAVNDQQTAEGALKAAREALRLFGKTEQELKIDATMTIKSPITGRVTARNAAPGQWVEPTTDPAPYAVADLSTVWLVAQVAESDISRIAMHEEAVIKVLAYPGKSFIGKITNIGASLVSHKLPVRVDLREPLLKPGMLATFTLIKDKKESLAVPEKSVVRESDGSFVVFLSLDGKLEKRVVKTGRRQNGFVEILEGLKTGESVLTEGALFQ